MKSENIKSLETLCWACHITGIFSVFIGLVVTLFDLLNNDFAHVQIGIYVLITGYAFVKIAKKINTIMISEQM